MIESENQAIGEVRHCDKLQNPLEGETPSLAVDLMFTWQFCSSSACSTGNHNTAAANTVSGNAWCIGDKPMLSQQRSFLRLFLLPSAFSASFRSVCPAILSTTTSPRRVTRRWTTHSNGATVLHDQWKGVSSVLVCGDGDLSYSAWLAAQLAEAGVSLTATVLEKEEVHNSGACGRGAARRARATNLSCSPCI